MLHIDACPVEPTRKACISDGELTASKEHFVKKKGRGLSSSIVETNSRATEGASLAHC
ncbi:MAG: hypothetical protein QXX87_02220 [Candidatus Jordarchaeales archaeon]